MSFRNVSVLEKVIGHLYMAEWEKEIQEFSFSTRKSYWSLVLLSEHMLGVQAEFQYSKKLLVTCTSTLFLKTALEQFQYSKKLLVTCTAGK